MRDFSNIKIGDEVFIQVAVNYGWNSGKSFTIKDEVVRVTKIQFVTKSGRRYKKDGGREIASSNYFSYASLEGEDQIEEFTLFKECVSKVNDIYSNSGNIHLPVSASIEDLDKVAHYLMQIRIIVSKYNNKGKQ